MSIPLFHIDRLCSSASPELLELYWNTLCDTLCLFICIIMYMCPFMWFLYISMCTCVHLCFSLMNLFVVHLFFFVYFVVLYVFMYISVIYICTSHVQVCGLYVSFAKHTILVKILN